MAPKFKTLFECGMRRVANAEESVVFNSIKKSSELQALQHEQEQIRQAKDAAAKQTVAEKQAKKAADKAAAKRQAKFVRHKGAVNPLTAFDQALGAEEAVDHRQLKRHSGHADFVASPNPTSHMHQAKALSPNALL